ncbi:protein RTA1 [Podospora australis]|uniref:Protein RTA1 n=1 Tax=Podospora australis TaxID=1536484 RepID=A0AAN6WTT0_9PEZI|nr:protein RTA1 [Podospora australis]
MESGQYVPGSVYFYAPNKGAPVFFAIAFALSGVYHIYQCIHYKSWRLTGLYVFCAVLFTAGFVVREMGAFDYTNLVKYIISICLIYGAPPLLELANYNILGRVLYYAPYHSPIHPGRVITTFAFVSAVVEALNGNGAALTANQSLPQWRQDIGRSLLKAALLIQVVVIFLFAVLAVTFHRRCVKAGLENPKIYQPLYTLYISTTLLMARTVFRVVEYWSIAQHNFWEPGFDPRTLSPALQYESFFYVFEAMLMLANSVLMNARHPRMWLPKSTKTYLDPTDGVTEVDGPGYKDGRKFWVTLVDPFDLWSLVGGGGGKGKREEDMFWARGNNTAALSDNANGDSGGGGRKRDLEAQ